MGKTLYSREHGILVERLKKARLEAGLGQGAAARMLRKSQSFISKIESGQRRIDVIQLKKIAAIYKKEISYFIEN